jgi:hypothetical protein
LVVAEALVARSDVFQTAALEVQEH